MFNNPFTPAAVIQPVQEKQMTAQTRHLLERLQAGEVINFITAKDHGISHLAQRVLELQASGHHIYQRPIRLHASPCMEYSLYRFPDQEPEYEDLNDIKPAAARQPVNEAFKERKR